MRAWFVYYPVWRVKANQLYICTNDTKSDDPSYDTAEAELSASLSTPPRSAPAYKFAASAPQLRQRRRCVAHNTI